VFPVTELVPVSVSVAAKWQSPETPPPLSDAVLPATIESISVTSCAFWMPPPLPGSSCRVDQCFPRTRDGDPKVAA
jgi:hypothetical protein